MEERHRARYVERAQSFHARSAHPTCSLNPHPLGFYGGFIIGIIA